MGGFYNRVAETSHGSFNWAKEKKNLICKVGQGTIIFIENRTKSVFHNSLGFLDSLYLPFVVFAGKCHSPRFSQIYSC